MTRFLFGSPTCFLTRHPNIALSAVLALIGLSQWIVDSVMGVML